jgi:threonine/homoserine/homoserine lactone efflux protein
MEDNTSILVIKVVFIFVCFIMTFLAGLVPMKWRACRNNDKWLGLANTFSGGVFLAIAFIHLIPETASIYYKYKF